MEIRATRLTVPFFLFLLSCTPASTYPTGAPPDRLPPEQSAAGTQLAQVLQRLSVERMRDVIAQLSHPEFNGRLTGSPDDRQSALWVATLFHSFGLLPAGAIPLGPGDEPWAQSQPASTVHIDDEPVLKFSVGTQVIRAGTGADYLPILDSPPIRATAPVVFVGYGISDPARGFDEYHGLDVRNRIVLFLRGKPERYTAPVAQAEKERTAREKGAIAFLTFQGPVLTQYEARRGAGPVPIASYSGSSDERPIPGCWISTHLADRLLAGEGRSLQQIQETIHATLKPQSFLTHVLAQFSLSSRRSQGTLYNVLGLLPAGDAQGRRDETVVIGAHRDHFGRQAGLLFAGADDNASGTAVIMEVARAMSDSVSGLMLKRNILFISFSGEEQNLLGSRLYVRSPARPLERTIAMINVDHAGIGNGRLTVGVTGLSQDIGQTAGQLAGLADRIDLFGFFPGGDHVPFKEAGVPTLAIVSGGVHPYFHQPSDRPETIQSEQLEKSARYVLALAWTLAAASAGE
jgi:hypothetical protein